MSGHVLSLFGGFDLKDDQGTPIALRSKKGKCLLAYLALAQGQRKPRDELAALLWGDRGDAQARRSLSQELYRLRGLFPEDIQDGFVLEAESVALEAGLFDVDAANFEHGLDSGDFEAAALYTGDLLAGHEANQEGFDEWLRGERERLRERAVTALHEIMRADLDGAPDAAANAAERILALDDASEEAHRALMQLHSRAGRRDLALRQYEKCREHLARELGIKPDGATRELYERIKTESGAAVEIAADDALPLPSKPSIAVLPFDNMSGDAEQEYFSDGIADEIITGLSQSGDLFVIARNSSFTYKGGAIDIKQVGRELGVRYVLEGGVRRAGERLRVIVRLIDAESGKHVWSDKYDGKFEDIFDLQDEITVKVIAAIGPSVILSEIERARRKRPNSLDAYELCMCGRAHEADMDRDGLEEARKYYLRTTVLDSRIAQAYTGLAGTYWWESVLGLADFDQNLAEALRAGRQAVEIDEGDASAHLWIAIPSLFLQRYDVAVLEVDRSVELNPNNALARGYRSCVYGFIDRPEEGVEEGRLALRLSPPDSYRFLFLHCLALCLYSAREYGVAAEAAFELVTLRPEYLYGHWHLAGSCAQLGQMDRADAAFRDLTRLVANFDLAFVEANTPFKHSADQEHMMDGQRKAGWEE
ncbi:MAG: BTAD domain-containing putative transcriptional regulator [Alphaproteobacteria bacterium]|nr:BTAD domain-containing putative transcriptional regulator [Alphaproteobacteria bacterium]